MHCDIRLRVSVTCTFTIKHSTHVPIVTCSHLYNAYRLYCHFNTTDCKGVLVQWIECRTPDSGADGSNHGVGRYFFLFTEKFTEYFQTFIYILARLSLCVIRICQVNACISASLIFYLVHIQSDCIMISFRLI